MVYEDFRKFTFIIPVNNNGLWIGLEFRKHVFLVTQECNTHTKEYLMSLFISLSNHVIYFLSATLFLEVAFTPSLGRAGRLLCTVVKRQQCKLSCVVCSSRGFYFLETNGTGCLFTLRSSPSFIFIMHQSQDFQAIHHQQGALQLLILLHILYRGGS